MSLSVINLTVSFSSADGQPVQALNGLSLTVERGEVAGLAGASGAGKSLVAETLMGLLPGNALVSGHVTVDSRKPRPGSLALAPQTIDALDPLARIAPSLRASASHLAGRWTRQGCLQMLGLSQTPPTLSRMSFPAAWPSGCCWQVLLPQVPASSSLTNPPAGSTRIMRTASWR